MNYHLIYILSSNQLLHVWVQRHGPLHHELQITSNVPSIHNESLVGRWVEVSLPAVSLLGFQPLEPTATPSLCSHQQELD